MALQKNNNNDLHLQKKKKIVTLVPNLSVVPFESKFSFLVKKQTMICQVTI